MDKFDESIKNAQQTYEPRSNFVDNTMQQIQPKQRHIRWARMWVPVLAGIIVIIVIVALLLPSSKSSVQSRNTSQNLAQSKPQTQASSSGETVADAPGTDNTSLQNDINGVQSAINQENADQTNANSTVNDSQQEITVPTD